MTSIKNRLAPLAPVAAGVTWTGLGLLRLIAPDKLDSGSSVEGAVGHVALAGMSIALLLMIPAMLELARRAARPTGAQVAAVGLFLLAALCTVSNVRGEDPSFFPPVAILSNLLWLGGSIALAVSLKRAGRVAPRVAVLLPASWIAALPLSVVGGSFLIGAYWITVGARMRQGTLERRAPAPAIASAQY